MVVEDPRQSPEGLSTLSAITLAAMGNSIWPILRMATVLNTSSPSSPSSCQPPTGRRCSGARRRMREGATWRHLRCALQKRAKLDSGEEELYWQFTSRRTGHGLSKEVVRMVHDFYVAHPSIKRSPIAGDVLKIKQADGSYVLTAKLLSEISLTDVFLDFQLEYPDVKIKERSFRYLRPAELRRMKTRHLEMCGCRRPARPPTPAPFPAPMAARPSLWLTHRPLCRWCVEMRLAQNALNAARVKLAQQHAAFVPAAVAVDAKVQRRTFDAQRDGRIFR